MGIKIKRVDLHSGDHIEVANGLTVLVGPNNAGKSLVLRELNLFLANGPYANPPYKSVAKIEVEYSGSPQEFFDRLGKSHLLRPAGTYSYGQMPLPHVHTGGVALTADHVANIWGTQGGLGVVSQVIQLHLDATGRLGAAINGSRWNPYRESPTTPAQKLFNSRELEKKINDFTMQAFNTPFTVHRYNGNEITFHVGSVMAEETPEPATPAYLDEIGTLPLWQEQGDGMRAFLGIVLAVMTTDYPIILIDEPEAFLHPPQARLLGRLLVELNNDDTQIIVATHSTDIIDGITSVATSKNEVSIARVTRADQGNRIAQVGADAIRELYDDPLVRYYNILDGLFANGTVLCEADSDCTYYRAVLGTLGSLQDGTPAQSVSAHFTHCGGKARLPKAVKALRSANVPVVCVVDFDFLQDDKDFKSLVTAYGGDPSIYDAWRNDITSAIMAKTKKPDRIVVKALVDDVFKDAKSGLLTSGEATKISNAISATSGWKEVKKAGRACLSGRAVTSFDELNAALQALGIYIVELGELERFHPEVGSDNKAAWLREVLESGKYRDSEDAKKLVSALITHIAMSQ